MGLGRLLKVSVAALAGAGRFLRLVSKTAVESVRHMAMPELEAHKEARKAKSRKNYHRSRGKHKARLHGRHQRRRGSGRTARRIKAKARKVGDRS